MRMATSIGVASQKSLLFIVYSDFIWGLKYIREMAPHLKVLLFSFVIIEVIIETHTIKAFVPANMKYKQQATLSRTGTKRESR